MHSGQHLELVERLGYIVAAAGLKGLLERPDPAIGADEEYRQAPLARQLLDAAARLVTVHHRHVDVHQHQIGELGGGIHRLQAVGGLPHPVTRLFQQTAQDVAVGCHVIDDQDFTHLFVLSCPGNLCRWPAVEHSWPLSVARGRYETIIRLGADFGRRVCPSSQN